MSRIKGMRLLALACMLLTVAAGATLLLALLSMGHAL